MKALRSPLRSPLRKILADAINTAYRSSAGSDWSPLSLFAASEQGVWYDPSDLTSMFQDSAGTTPVTAVEQPVGLILDRRLGLALGAEIVGNADFASDTWWTKGSGVAISGGKANLTAASGYALYRSSVAEIVAGGYYEVTYTVSGYAGGSIRPYVGATAAFGPTVSANGTHTTRICASSGGELGLNCPTAFTGSIDDISVKRVAGNHATQATAPSRPTYKVDSTLSSLGHDGGDDYMTAAAGGGGTAGITLIAGIRLDALGAARTIWSDAGTNTGYRLRINSSNQVVFEAGNGSAYTSATVSTALTSGQKAVITAWHDGATLSVQVDNGTPATASFGTASAGTSGFTVGRTNGSATEYFNGRLYGVIYVRGEAKTSHLSSARSWMATKSGVTL